MKYLFNEMGMVEAGKFVQVDINRSANVRIMDKENFEKFKKLEIHDYIGGFVKFTPYITKLPRSDHWFVVVDLGGQEGSVSAKVSIYTNERKIKPVLF